MAAWASLSGYLFIKPGGGGLSRLKSRKKQWCVLDESRGQLLHHKCEEDARSKPPVGYIELRGAAITLDLDNQNQFVIIVDNKEVYLTAENHESMMIWLVALQSKRDQFAKLLTSSGSSDAAATTAAAAATTTTGGRGAPGVVGFLEEQRERVGRVKGRAPRPSLPHLFFSSSSSSFLQRPGVPPLSSPSSSSSSIAAAPFGASAVGRRRRRRSTLALTLTVLSPCVTIVLSALAFSPSLPTSLPTVHHV